MEKVTEILLLILELAAAVSFVLSKGTKGPTSSSLLGDAVKKHQVASN